MPIASSIRAMDIVIDHLEGAVCRGAVDNQVRNIRIILLEYAVECALQYLRSLIGDGDICNGHDIAS